MVQDPVAPNLLFLGTDQGLYFSIDYGDSWTHWPVVKAGEPGGFPCVPVQDMKIHPRDGDLVIGTFGRAIWIMDNIAPLRELAKNPALFDQPFKLFNPQAAVLASWRSFDGARFPADASFTGANKDAAARVPVWIKPGAAPKAEKKEGGDKTEEPAVRRGRFGRGGPGGGRRNEKVDVLVLSAAAGSKPNSTPVSVRFTGASIPGASSFPRTGKPTGNRTSLAAGPAFCPEHIG